MATFIDRVVKSETRYEPGPLPEEVSDLGNYVVTELKRIGSIFLNQATFRLECMHVEPTRPRKGDIRYADGTDWNPGSGEGIYFFNNAGTWIQL